MPSFKTTAFATALSLALIFGLLWWDDRTTQPAVRRAEIPTVPASVRAAESMQSSARDSVPPGREISKIAGKPADNGQGATAPAAPALPLVLRFSRRIRDPDQPIEGSIENTSDGNLAITVSVLSARTQRVSRSTLEAPARSRIVFGRDDGVNLASGDRITLESPTYEDLVQQVR